MACKQNFRKETYEQYYGNVDEVKKHIQSCQQCGTKMVFAHQSDYSEFLIQERSNCPNCGFETENTFHAIN